MAPWDWCCGGDSATRWGATMELGDRVPHTTVALPPAPKKEPADDPLPELSYQTEGGVRVFDEALEYCPYMLEEGNQILRKMRDTNPSNNLVNVSFTYLNVGDEAVEWIAKTLFLNRRLQRLHLQHNQITGEGVRVLASELEGNPSISELHLGYNQVSDEGIHALGSMLGCNTNLTSLYLTRNNNRFSDKACGALAASLAGNTTLRDLDLADNGGGVGDQAAAAFAAALEANATLTRLDLFGGCVTDAGGARVAAALRGNTALTELNLGGQRAPPRAGFRDALPLGDALPPVLRQFGLDPESPGRAEAGRIDVPAALAQRGHATVTEVRVLGDPELCFGEAKQTTQLSQAESLALDDAPEHEKRRREREAADARTLHDACRRVLGDETGTALAAALGGDGGADGGTPVNTGLRSLVLVGNACGDSTASAFAAALRRNASLTVLNLGSNVLSETGVGALDDFMTEASGTSRMKHLNTYENPGVPGHFMERWKGKGGEVFDPPDPISVLAKSPRD